MISVANKGCINFKPTFNRFHQSKSNIIEDLPNTPKDNFSYLFEYNISPYTNENYIK